MRKRVASVSVDLDPIDCYYRIHGLGDPPEALRGVVLRSALPRFLDLFASRSVRATFFFVAAELDGDTREAEAARALAREVVAAGHEIANHTLSHRYDLARLPPACIALEIGRAHESIALATCVFPLGFRSPGYGLSPSVLEEVARLGYRYDSSVLPAPLYWLAKAAVMGALRLAGRPSRAVLTDPRLLGAPTVPYRPDSRRPWRRGQSPVVELPIAVTPFLRVPVIGTTLLEAPAVLRTRWLERMKDRPFFNLELHGVDLLDAELDGIPAALTLHQHDLTMPLTEKRRTLDATLATVAGDASIETLAEVASTVQRQEGLA